MKYFLGFVVWCSLAVACGSGSVCGGDCTDAGVKGDVANDVVTTDAPADVSTDVATKDGGLQSGAPCDLQNDQCATGLKCCTEPTHIPDASTHDICAPVQDGGICPMYP
jgi:hypothetical protein